MGISFIWGLRSLPPMSKDIQCPINERGQIFLHQVVKTFLFIIPQHDGGPDVGLSGQRLLSQLKETWALAHVG